MEQHGSHTHPRDEQSDALDHYGPTGTTSDLILAEHLEKALTRASDDEARYHIRAALQRLELE